MLNQQEILDLSQEHFPTDSYGAEIFGSGYNVCNETIPSECIAFAEWIDDNQILRVNHKYSISWYSQRMDKFLCSTTVELYSIYLESILKK
jgi:hypothetical protein